jgi:hypothetical protein
MRSWFRHHELEGRCHYYTWDSSTENSFIVATKIQDFGLEDAVQVYLRARVTGYCVNVCGKLNVVTSIDSTVETRLHND